jgi:hypothetical protein
MGQHQSFKSLFFNGETILLNIENVSDTKKAPETNRRPLLFYDNL